MNNKNNNSNEENKIGLSFDFNFDKESKTIEMTLKEPKVKLNENPKVWQKEEKVNFFGETKTKIIDGEECEVIEGFTSSPPSKVIYFDGMSPTIGSVKIQIELKNGRALVGFKDIFPFNNVAFVCNVTNDDYFNEESEIKILITGMENLIECDEGSVMREAYVYSFLSMPFVSASEIVEPSNFYSMSAEGEI